MKHRDVLVKMCGLRSVGDVAAACDAGADLLGIVFVPGARRSVDLPTARTMVRTARAHSAASVVAVVGGAVDPSDAAALIAELGVDAVQLVGTEASAMALLDPLRADISIIRAVAVTTNDTVGAEQRASAWEARGARVVFEPHVDGALGGTGTMLATDVRNRLLERSERGIAGGLRHDNVAQIVRESAPGWVDVSSGIERAGRKDPELMRLFVDALRGAAA